MTHLLGAKSHAQKYLGERDKQMQLNLHTSRMYHPTCDMYTSHIIVMSTDLHESRGWMDGGFEHSKHDKCMCVRPQMGFPIVRSTSGAAAQLAKNGRVLACGGSITAGDTDLEVKTNFEVMGISALQYVIEVGNCPSLGGGPPCPI